MIKWLKENKIVVLLLLVIGFLLFRGKITPIYKTSTSSRSDLGMYNLAVPEIFSSAPKVSSGIAPLPSDNYVPTDSSKRIVVQSCNLSLVVKDVRTSVDKIIENAQSVGGYMVSSTLSQPEEAPYAYVSLRVPAKSLKASLNYYRSLSIKVASENLYGNDVTDEYTDIQGRLQTLNKTKTKFEEILNRAVMVSEILEVQREIINLQSQIDSWKGREQYLEKTAELALISINLSTDEYSLPYAPTDTFRPAVIFKQAVRSLVGALRSIAVFIIWIGVFSIIWVPVLLVVRFFRKRANK